MLTRNVNSRFRKEIGIRCFQLMSKFSFRRRVSSATASFLRGFLALFLLASALAGAAAGADVPKPSTLSVGPGLPFAVADFDGDQRPDLVGVETGESGVFRTNYWIQLQLTVSGRQTISIVAPSGGLQIAARDVNGDQIPDLILTTTWLRQPVAIFINDGHGTFSRVASDAFPDAFRESQTGWDSSAHRMPDSVAVASSLRAAFNITAARSPHAERQTGAVASSRRGFLPSPFLISSPGRAPPSAVPYL
jgi:hypothetical protein